MEIIDQDDVFFADLSNQISLLIMEDDDDLPLSHYRHPPASFQVFCRQTTQSQMLYEQSCKREQSKGTGVFIPRSTQPSKENPILRQQTPSFTSILMITQGLASNNYNSFNQKRS